MSRDPDRAARAYAIYLGATGQEPPDARRMNDVGTFMVLIRARGGYGRDEVVEELGRLVPPEVSRQWYLWNRGGALLGDVVVSGVAKRRKVIAALSSSKVLSLYGDVNRWCDLATPKDSAELRDLAAAAATQAAPAGPETYPRSSAPLRPALPLGVGDSNTMAFEPSAELISVPARTFGPHTSMHRDHR